jgi:hypothetical protein
MNTTHQHSLPLADYVDLPQLLPTVRQTFPTTDSIKWFVRRHRAELATSGAMIALTGRLLFHPGRFSEVAVDIGRAQAGGDKVVLGRAAHIR